MTSTFSGLLNGLLFAGTLTAAVWVALRFVPRRTLNAATRYVIWWVSLVCAVALPGAYRIWKSPARHPIPAPHPAILASPANISIAPMDVPALAAVVVPVHVSHPDWVRRLLLLWPAISAMLLLRLALGCLLLNRLKRRGREARPEVQARAAKWLERCAGSRSGVRVLISEDIATPVAAGPRNPAILIPASLYDELSPDDLDRIGLHESAHLARRDDYALLVERAIQAIFFFHPLVLWISRHIDLEREIACDDLVIAACGQPRSYAACLTRIVESGMGLAMPWPAAPAAENSSHLARRVEALLDRTRRAGAHLMKYRFAATTTVLLTVAFVALRAPALVAFVPRLAKAKLAAVLPLPTRASILPVPQRALTQTDLPADPGGAVVEDSTGSPIASVELRFKKTGMRELAADLDTDSQGRFSAPGLPPGDYSIEVSKPNYASSNFRLHVPSPALHLQLVHYGVIDGKILNAEGHPLAGRVAPYGRTTGAARITILVKSPDTGQMKMFRNTSPDEEGAWRVYDLPPGQYAVALWYWGLDEGSGIEFYPDNSNPRFFTVKSGEQYTGIDFNVVPQPSSQIAGRVEMPEGAKGPVQLALGIPDQPVLPLSQIVSERDGTFHFDKVPAGTYDLFAAGPATGYTVFESILDESARPYFGHQRIQVSGQNIENLVVPVGPAKTVNVVLRAENADGCPATADVVASPLEPWAIRLQTDVPADFRQPRAIANLMPGKVRFTARDLGNTCFQMNDSVADLTGDAPPLIEIKLAGAGSIHGTMRSAAAGSRILLTPAAADNNQSRSAYTDALSHFEFENVRPGRYRIAGANIAATGIDVKSGAPTEVEF